MHAPCDYLVHNRYWVLEMGQKHPLVDMLQVVADWRSRTNGCWDYIRDTVLHLHRGVSEGPDLSPNIYWRICLNARVFVGLEAYNF